MKVCKPHITDRINQSMQKEWNDQIYKERQRRKWCKAFVTCIRTKQTDIQGSTEKDSECNALTTCTRFNYLYTLQLPAHASTTCTSFNYLHMLQLPAHAHTTVATWLMLKGSGGGSSPCGAAAAVGLGVPFRMLLFFPLLLPLILLLLVLLLLSLPLLLLLLLLLLSTSALRKRCSTRCDAAVKAWVAAGWGARLWCL